jgi:hypothetical protein
MSWLRTVLSEFVGLFVDDSSYALAIVGWIVVAWLVLPHLPGAWPAAIFFLGLAAILVESTARRARRGR